jgi:hypothetical protein
VLSAAEFAAMLAGVLEQDTSPGEDAVTAITDWQEVEMTRGALLTLPKGTKASSTTSRTTASCGSNGSGCGTGCSTSCSSPGWPRPN